MTTMARVVGVIPARMASSRYPGKPLAPLLGLPMVEHVYRRSMLCDRLDDVWVATCDEEIRAAAEGFGGKAVMTSERHERATDRVAEAAGSLDADIVVMIQGDEPLVTPAMIAVAVDGLVRAREAGCVNLVAKIESESEYRSPHTIKVVRDRASNALYFSREPIPTLTRQGWGSVPVFKQVCIIPFRRDVLLRYPQLDPTPLERAESVDMLRLVESGYDIRLVETSGRSHAVDLPEDRDNVERLLAEDPVTKRYIDSSHRRESER